MKSLLTAFSLPIFFFFFSRPLPVNDVPDKLLIALQQWYDDNPQEKVFVQTDRDKYIAGESIWIKAWCTLNGRPTFLSRIIYVDLVDQTGNVIEKKMFSLDNISSTSSVIDLPKDLKSGNYSLNAYTLWMLNYPSYLFKKNLFIYNTDYKKDKKSLAQTFSLQFFPEGGDMVENVKGRIAFKGVNENGFAQEFKGIILNAAGTKITDINTEHDGMGVFEITPATNTTYKAEIFIKGKKYEYDLPMAKKEGIGLQIENANANRLFVLVTPGEVNKAKYNKLFLIAHINGVPVYNATFNISEGETGASISKKTLPAGVLHLTLFDSTGFPLAERLAFISNQNIISPSIQNTKSSFSKRGKSTFSFSLDSIKNADLSIAITDGLVDKENYSDNIASSLLLTSDIKGYVNNPTYYFANKDVNTLRHLDLLLMTQGWRRFNWRQIKGEEKITLKYPVESALNIKGKVTKSGRKEAVTNGTVSLIIKAEDSTTILSTANLTDKGEFIVDSINFLRRATISLQGNNKKNELPVDVTIYPSYIDSLKKSPLIASVNLDTTSTSDYTDYVNNALQNLMATGKEVLENVTVKTKKISRIDSIQREYVSPIYEQSDNTIEVPEKTGYSNIWQFLNSQIPGFSVNPNEPVTSVTFNRNVGINALSEDGSSERTIQFILNEIPVSTDIIDGLNFQDVALVKVYKGALAFPFGADGGAIAIYTKKGVGAGKPYEKRFDKMKKMGFEVSREFYSPNYTLNPELNKDVVDSRITLYWNPKIKPSKDGTYTVDFHNNDITKKYKVVIQGIDKTGKLIYKEQIIQ